jgi:hypothetical protein
MALTKITGQVVNTSTDLTVGVLTATTVSVGGTLTYEDVTNVDSVGLITARNGIQVTDKGVQVGTGATVDSAAANTLTFLTGGSERLRIDSSGELVSNNGTLRRNVSDSSFTVSGDSASNTGANINLFGASHGSLASVFRVRTGSTERLRITSDGDVGIGEDSPADRLAVQETNASGDVAVRIKNDTTTDGSAATPTTASLYLTTSTGDFNTFYMQARRTDNNTHFGYSDPRGDNHTPNLVIASGGDIGISETTPDSKVDIVHSTSTNSSTENLIHLRTDPGAGYVSRGLFVKIGRDGSYDNSAVHYDIVGSSGNSGTHIFEVQGSEKLRIDSSGRLLLGTTTEGHATADNFTIADSGHCGITLRSGDDDVGTIFFSDGTSGDAEYEGYVQYDHTGNFMKFATNHAETLRIDSSGLITQGGKTASNHGSPNLLLWGADPTLHISATGSTNNTSFTGIKFAVAGGSTGDYSKAGIFVQRQSSYNDLDMIFAFRATNDSAGVAISDEKLRIDSDGKVLIGTTSNFVRGNLQVIDGGGGEVTIGRNDTSVSEDNDLGHLYFASNDESGTGVLAASMEAYADANHTSASAPTRLTFAVTAVDAVSPTERARIVAKGTSHFSNTGSYYGSYSGNTPNHFSVDSNLAQWTVGFRNSGSNPYGIRIKYDTDKTNSSNEFMYAGDSALKYAINSNGGVVNFQSNNTNLCDEREKKNIVSLDSKWDKVKSWELKKFHYNEDDDTDDLKYGVIAQQVETLCPEVISDWKKSEGVIRKGVKEQQMMWMAIKALQESQVRIETLEAQNADLLSRVTALEG